MQGKVTSETSANPSVHVGIDVCKARLDLLSVTHELSGFSSTRYVR
jgi:hypothetical protein